MNRHINNYVLALAVSALPLHAAASEGFACKDQHLAVVPTLAALPWPIAELVGRYRAGRAGIADAGEQFNDSCLVSDSLPDRRFGIGAASESCALVAIELGGYSRSVELWSFSKSKDVWRGTRITQASALTDVPDSVAALLAAAVRQEWTSFRK